MFEFASAGRIVFGPGVRLQLLELAQPLGQKPLLVCGRPRANTAPLVAALNQHFGECLRLEIRGEPEVEQIVLAVESARQGGCDSVIAIGGGSVIDAGKAVAALCPNAGDALDYLEVIGKGRPLQHPALPLLAAPTTAGTGAEVTKNAVLGHKLTGVKVSLRHASMLPRVALVDSELTWSVPADVTRATGLDALTQVLEPYVSRQATPLTDAVCGAGLMRVGRALRGVVEDPLDAAARDDMALVSLCGGLALANAKLGAVHGFAAPLGGMFPAPHGAVCARLLPFVVAANLRALEAREPTSPGLPRYTQVARWLTGDAYATAQDGVRWLNDLCDELQVAPLAHYGVQQTHLSEIANKAARASSMQGNPISLSLAELHGILEQAL